MQQIRCPKCGEVFTVDESGYAAILKQVRDSEFEKEMHARHKRFEEEKEAAVLLAEAKTRQSLQKALSDREAELAVLKTRLEGADSDKRLAVAEALKEKDEALAESREIVNGLKGKIGEIEKESLLKEQQMKEQYEKSLHEKEEQIAYYRDFKARQSTKMIGESLEQHCETEFNRLRATAFPNAYFEKDNDARTGSKGDYIFRECDENGTEIVSIMFEMKNEADTTAAKHKNEDFFKELDRDRNEKNCEYAVLVSLLESDSELYNTGIVDVSYRYPKMYVIRPQFFIPMITLLKNAAMNALLVKQELAQVKNQNLDIVRFEENMNDFKQKFSRNYRIASDRFKTAIDEIDKTIAHLQKTKDALLSSENNLRLANQKAEDLSLRKLAKGAPHLLELLEETKEGEED